MGFNTLEVLERHGDCLPEEKKTNEEQIAFAMSIFYFSRVIVYQSVIFGILELFAICDPFILGYGAKD